MRYRAILESSPETVQDLVISAALRLEEAMSLHTPAKYHAAIYIAGLAAEMYLKTPAFWSEARTSATRWEHC